MFTKHLFLKVLPGQSQRRSRPIKRPKLSSTRSGPKNSAAYTCEPAKTSYDLQKAHKIKKNRSPMNTDLKIVGPAGRILNKNCY